MTPPGLLEQVRAEIRARHDIRRTEDASVHWIRRFIVFHGRRRPARARRRGDQRVSHVAGRGRARGGINTEPTLSGVLFLYREVLRQDIGVVELLPRARMPTKVPVVLSPSEVRLVLDQLTGVPRMVATLLYGAGLRLQECLELRVKDLDFERREITVRRGKGQKDRRVMLPDASREVLERHLAEVRRLHHADLAVGLVTQISTGTLCTLALEPEGYPYGSFVTVAFDDGNPVFLISGLAEHTKNLERDPARRCSWPRAALKIRSPTAASPCSVRARESKGMAAALEPRSWQRIRMLPTTPTSATSRSGSCA